MKNFLVFLVFLFVIGRADSQQWQDVTPAEYAGSFFSSSCFLNASEGWIFARPASSNNYDLIHTADSAQSFEKLLTLTNNMECWKIQMVDNLYGYAKIEDGAANKNYFWKTSDGGQTWQDITDTALFNPGNPLYSCHAFYFTNRNTGFFGGHQSIYKTLDGGSIWQKMNAPQVINSSSPARPYRANDIYFTDANHGWATCSLLTDGGFGMKTIDGGESWAVCTPITGDLWRVHFANNLKGCMSGNGSFFSALLITDNNFQTQPKWLFPEYQYPSPVCYQNDSTLWYSGSPPILNRSTDGGLTFKAYDTAFAAGHVNGSITNIQFFGNTGYALANIALLKLADTLSAVSVASLSPAAENRISPNPASDKCKICITAQKSEPVIVELHTAAGLKVFKTRKYMVPGTNEITLDLTHFKSGVYILKMSSSTLQLTKKLVKQ